MKKITGGGWILGKSWHPPFGWFEVFEDVAEVVYFVVNAPEHVNVADVLLLPTAQRNVYVVHREDA